MGNAWLISVLFNPSCKLLDCYVTSNQSYTHLSSWCRSYHRSTPLVIYGSWGNYIILTILTISQDHKWCRCRRPLNHNPEDPRYVKGLAIRHKSSCKLSVVSELAGFLMSAFFVKSSPCPYMSPFQLFIGWFEVGLLIIVIITDFVFLLSKWWHRLFIKDYCFLCR